MVAYGEQPRSPSAFWSQGCYTMSPEARGQISDEMLAEMEIIKPSKGTIENIYINLENLYNNMALRYGTILGLDEIENCAN